MTKTRSTKRALLFSALSILMCVSMLVGSTFAWFTDSVTSGVNKIVAGNLDIELEYYNGSKWLTVDNATDLFSNENWEPGHTEVVYLKLSNLGYLALKYHLGINIASEIASISAETNEAFKISDFIRFSVIGNKNGETDAFADRDAALAAAQNLVGGNKLLNTGYSSTGYMLANQAPLYMAMVVYIPKSVGNEANYKTNAPIPTVNLGINMMATQKDFEDDSFGDDYDIDASNVVNSIAALRDAINNASDNEIIFIESGVYDVDGVITAANGKTITLIGLGTVTLNNTSNVHLFNVTNESSVTFRNINMNGNGDLNKGKNGIFVRYNSSVTLIDSHVYNTKSKDICIDQASDELACVGKTSTVKLINSTVEDVSACALPWPTHSVGSIAAITGNSYVKFYYDANSSVGSISKDAGSAAENIYVNDFNQTTGSMIADGLWLVAPNVYEIASPAGLVNLATAIPDWTAEVYRTVNLKKDLDMTGVDFAPLSKMFIRFNGNGHTISNLTVDGSGDWAGRSGLFAYLGGGSIENLTLKNVTSTGSEAGLFVGQTEGGDILNCTVEGNNVVTWSGPSADRVGDGIGVFAGVTVESSSDYSGTIADGAVVTLNKGMSGNQIAKTDVFAGGLYANCTPNVSIVNNGEIVNGITVSAIDEFETALTKLSAESANVITFATDIVGDITVVQKANVDLVIDGNDHSFNGLMTVDGDGRQSGSETLGIQNINFIAKAGAASCIYSPDREDRTPAKYSYSHNVTVYNCTFTDPDGAVDCAAIRHGDGGDKNWTVKKCTVDATMHSLLQINNVAGDGITIDDCTVNSKNGINMNQCAKVNVLNSRFNTVGYAVRFGVAGATVNGSFLIQDSTLKSANDDGDAVIIFRGTMSGSTLTLVNTTLNGTPEFTGTANIVR